MRQRHQVQPELIPATSDGLLRVQRALEEQIALGGGGGGGSVLDIDGGDANNSGTAYIEIDGGDA